MDNDQSPGDKPYDATPQRLEEARRKGEIVRSADLNTAIIYGGLLLGTVLVAPWATQILGIMTQVLLGQAETLAPLMLAPGGMAVSAGIIWPGLLIIIVVTAIPGLLLVISLLAQRAILFTPDNLMPKLSRIGPISQAKNKFGSHGLFQFAKSAIKLALISILLTWFLWQRADQVLGAIYASPGQVLLMLGQLCMAFLMVIFAIALVMGGADYLWEWAQHQNKNRMTRQEIIDESKQSEGDPHFKQHRRARGQAIALNQMLADVPKADVIVVNPTHYAVALKWDRGNGGVPICVAKGVDEIAARIRELAATSGIPIYSDPPTARALHATIEIGARITPDQYRAVAAAIRFADMIRQKARGSHR